MYVIHALVAKRELLEKHAEEFPGAKVIGLAQGFAMIPFTSKLFEVVGGASVLDFEEVNVELRFDRLQGVGEWAAKISRDGIVAYIEAEYFGGDGMQTSAVWHNGELRFAPIMSAEPGPINQALKLMGVKNEGWDEFASVGLQRHRSPEKWLNSARIE